MEFQFVNWFPEWRGFYCFRWHKEKSDMAYIYDWFIGFAFWEIRKWHNLKQAEISFKAGYDKAMAQLAGMTEECEQAGIRKVVEWIKKMKGEEDYIDSNYIRRTSILIDKEAWQVKLKEWGIDGERL